MRTTNGPNSSPANNSTREEKFHTALFLLGEFIDVLKDPDPGTNRIILSEILTLAQRGYSNQDDPNYSGSAKRLPEALRNLVNGILDNGLDQVQFPQSETGEYPQSGASGLHIDNRQLDEFLNNSLPLEVLGHMQWHPVDPDLAPKEDPGCPGCRHKFEHLTRLKAECIKKDGQLMKYAGQVIEMSKLIRAYRADLNLKRNPSDDQLLQQSKKELLEIFCRIHGVEESETRYFLEEYGRCNPSGTRWRTLWPHSGPTRNRNRKIMKLPVSLN